MGVMDGLRIKGRFLPVIDGYVYEREPRGPGYFVTRSERSQAVRFILIALPLVIVAALGTAALMGVLISGSYDGLGRSFPAMLVIALLAVAALYLGFRWVLLAPARAMASRPNLAPEQIRDLRRAFEDSLPEFPAQD